MSDDARLPQFREIEARWAKVRPEPWDTLNAVCTETEGWAYYWAPVDVSWLLAEVRRLRSLLATDQNLKGVAPQVKGSDSPDSLS